MNTISTLVDRFGVDVHDHLDRELSVPVHAGLQRQGDVIVVPRTTTERASKRIPATGRPVISGADGHTHVLLADGNVRYNPEPRTGQVLGYLWVPDGATAWLAHPEHAYTGIGPGSYEIRRQREFRGVIQFVAD